jgi:uncharacterized protein involved in exopolysaccharide biosynthesis
VETNIDDEIATLREQITAAEEEVGRLRAQATPVARGDASAAEDGELAELTEALTSMTVRLSRLLSCKRTLP